MKLMFRKIMLSTACSLLIYSLCVISYYQPVRAAMQLGQVAEETWKNSAKVGDLESRESRNETIAQGLQQRVDAMNERLSKMESTAESSNKLIMGSLGGIIIILIERGVAVAGRRKREESQE